MNFAIVHSGGRLNMLALANCVRCLAIWSADVSYIHSILSDRKLII